MTKIAGIFASSIVVADRFSALIWLLSHRVARVQVRWETSVLWWLSTDMVEAFARFRLFLFV